MEIKGRVIAIYFCNGDIFLKVELDEEFLYVNNNSVQELQKTEKFIYLMFDGNCYNHCIFSDFIQLKGQKIEVKIKTNGIKYNCKNIQKFEPLFEIDWIGVI
ncbi:hypothetical protein SAMN02745164_02044 [Marinitoga hydrogenitolerans DSM 16785]|uniref:Uncharacterized protein n=1 Tax=Marinitoga hydrogenitolerans (strain DSM 16785 / JCM 12826 / AT1271) TaxID=1122195 RepID=A0A1M4ZXK0_MARH1|nr:hypothetical protein [Marinitoga hydrogenitolerans]SHF22705.1 hypothetical protein SAMN02745164_02044 [Marinitoga hydrogenitolerans DSM 16785]